MKVFRNDVAFVSRFGLCVLFVDVCATQERCPDRKDMGFGWYMCREEFQTIGMLKGGAKTMHGLYSCIGSRHVCLVCIFWVLQCETVVRVKGVEGACAKGEGEGKG